MKISKIMAGIAASALAVSAMAVNVAAVDATGADGEVGIAFSGGDWCAQYWLDGKEYKSTAHNAVITGDGTYTVSVDAAAEFEDEETGEMVTVDGTTDLAFAAIEVVNGETLFPGMILTIDSIKFDGVEVAFTGTPYTSSDDGVTTRANIYNEWVSQLPEDARTIDGLAADASATPIDKAVGAWTTMEVTFTVSGTGVAGDAAEDDAAADDATADTTADTTTDTTTTTTGDKTTPDTGVEGVAAVAGLAIVAAGAVIVAKKRK
ncbi:MAG: hypothetical protein ACI4J1_08880 [Ruminiclostridium sp.]